MLDPYSVVLEALREDNRKTEDALLQACANWILLHAEGTRHVRQFGAQVLHPKTGVPVANPWLRTIATAERAMFGKTMAKIKKDGAFAALEAAQRAAEKTGRDRGHDRT